MRVLVTGGAGFIGSKLCLGLVNEGYQVICLDNLMPQIHGTQSFPSALVQDSSIKCVEGDVRDLDCLNQVLEGVECVFHLASETGTGQSMYSYDKYTSVNCGGTGALLEAIGHQNGRVRRLILSSSRSIYGEGEYWCETCQVDVKGFRNYESIAQGQYDPIHHCGTVLKPRSTRETCIKDPLSYYAVTKSFQEDAIVSASETLNFEYQIFRFQNVYGPGQSLSNPYTGILSIFSTLIRNDQKINIFEDGNESRDFVYIDDVIEFLLKSVEINIHQPILNIGSGVSTSVLDVVNSLYRAFDAKPNYEISGMVRKGDIRHNYANLDNLFKAYGRYPFTEFKVGITKFSEWVLKQPTSESRYEESLRELESKGLFVEHE